MKLTDSIYVQLRDEIFSAKYKPNELITERQIAEKYGTSKLTAGEVLQRLCTAGHLTSYPRSGYMVTVLTPVEIRQLNRIRTVIESLVLEIVCAECSGEEIRSLRQLIDPQHTQERSFAEQNRRFHMGLAELTHDRFIISTLMEILGSLSRVEQNVSSLFVDSWQDEHRHIVDALARRDIAAAKQALLADLDQLA